MSEPQSTSQIIRASIDFFSYLSEGNECLLEEGVPLQYAEGEGVGGINVAASNWPPLEDTRLANLCKKFCAKGGIPLLTIDAHLALFCVLQLRSECGLRGIRPSRLFGYDIVSLLCRRGILGNTRIEIEMNRSNDDKKTVDGVSADIDPADRDGDRGRGESIDAIRTEFIMQCFRQLGATRSPTLYRLSSLWKYSLHDVRIMHINALLELYLDELVDEMIPQVRIF